jgi:hypothetical protein
METRQFDRITATFAQTRSRRSVLGVLGVAAFGASGVSLLSVAEGEAKRRGKGKKKKKNQNQNQDQPQQPQQPQQPVLVPDVAITSITVATTAEAAHDDIVVQFINNGTQTATGFRIGMSAKRTDGMVRNEVYSLPQTLAPGVIGFVTFRLGCSWVNNGTVTARTDPSPIPGESNGTAADNLRTVTFGNAVCS